MWIAHRTERCNKNGNRKAGKEGSAVGVERMQAGQRERLHVKCSMAGGVHGAPLSRPLTTTAPGVDMIQ